MGFNAGGHGGGWGAPGLTHNSLEAWGSRDEVEGAIRTKNKQLGVSHRVLAVDGQPRASSGHEGGRERTEGHLGHLRVAGRIGGSPAKLKGGKNGTTELPQRLPIAPESASVASRVNGNGLVGFTGARRRPKENQGRSGMQVGC